MIRFMFLQNRQGKTRLAKWYVTGLSVEEKIKVQDEVHRLVVGRDPKHTNFIEVRPPFSPARALFWFGLRPMHVAPPASRVAAVRSRLWPACRVGRRRPGCIAACAFAAGI